MDDPDGRTDGGGPLGHPPTGPSDTPRRPRRMSGGRRHIPTGREVCEEAVIAHVEEVTYAFKD